MWPQDWKLSGRSYALIDLINIHTNRIGLVGTIGNRQKRGVFPNFLGTPFRLNLHTEDVDRFFYAKIAKKLDY